MTRDTNPYLHLVPRACLAMEATDKACSTLGQSGWLRQCRLPLWRDIPSSADSWDSASSSPAGAQESSPSSGPVNRRLPRLSIAAHASFALGSCAHSMSQELLPLAALYFCQQVRRTKCQTKPLSSFIPGNSSVAGFSSESWEAFCEAFSDGGSFLFVFGSGSSLDLNTNS